MILNIYVYLLCFLDKKIYQGSKEETLEFKWEFYIPQWISSQKDNA